MQKDIMEIIQNRRSIRRFTNDEVPESIIEIMARAASWAPSPSNRQSINIIALRNKEVLKRMSAAVKKEVQDMEGRAVNEDALKGLRQYGKFFTFFDQAPLVLVVTYREGPSFRSLLTGTPDEGAKSLAEISGTAAAVQNMLLTCHSLGYGACWMTGPLLAEDELAALLEVRRPHRLAAIIPVGKPAEVPPAPPRKEPGKFLRMVD